MRRSPKVAEVLPVLYLRGLSTGDFREALPILLGDDASGLSPTTIMRLTLRGRGNTGSFAGAICATGSMCTSGSTGSTSTFASRPTGCVRW